ncbi:hypothetical protein [Saccharomonospora piscinae]|nr:hypothetical protein [Saccharomonospora piscinae]
MRPNRSRTWRIVAPAGSVIATGSPAASVRTVRLAPVSSTVATWCPRSS